MSLGMEIILQSKKRENSVVWLIWHLTDKQAPLDAGCHGGKLQKLIQTCILTQLCQRLLGDFSTYNRFMA